MLQSDFQEFINDYATNFSLHKDIIFNAAVRKVDRNSDDTKWTISVDIDEKPETREFDKVIFCHGYQTKKSMPTFPGQEHYTGRILHSQEYRNPEDFKGQKVVIVGLSNTTSDIAPFLIPHASKVYVSHRRGNVLGARYRRGTPGDLMISWRRRSINWWMLQHLPSLHKLAADTAAKHFATKLPGYKIDPAWRLYPFASVVLKLPGLLDELIPALSDGTLTSLHGIKSFPGGKAIEFQDGTVLQDVDAIIFATGYTADWSVAPFVEKSQPTKEPAYAGPDMARLYMNIFPPKYADSCAMLCYSAFGKNNGFSFSDVISMAISNIWRGVDTLPAHPEMEAWIDTHHNWVARRWLLEPTIDVSAVKQYEFQPWLHQTAGTGMENLGWGLAGWRFWWSDRKMYNLMAHGLETAHMFRYFETGKRKTWPGAREAIIHQNEVVKAKFPLGDQEKTLEEMRLELRNIKLD